MQQTISLEMLPKALRQKKDDTLNSIATWIIKYQKFKTRVALEHAPEGYAKCTLMNYFDFGVSHIKYGKDTAGYRFLYRTIDGLLKKHIQPLTPSEKDARRVSKKDYTRKDNPPPVAKLEIVNKPLVTTYQYGIQTETTIRLCPSEDYAMGYLDALRESGDEISKIVTVELGEP